MALRNEIAKLNDGDAIRLLYTIIDKNDLAKEYTNLVRDYEAVLEELVKVSKKTTKKSTKTKKETINGSK